MAYEAIEMAHLKNALYHLEDHVRHSLSISGEKSLTASADELIQDIKDEIKRRERTDNGSR